MDDEVKADQRKGEGQGQPGERLGLAFGIPINVAVVISIVAIVGQDFAHGRIVRAEGRIVNCVC